jgi:hypothetical protein
VRRGEEGESEWRPGENGRDDPAKEAREKSKGEEKLDEGEGGGDLRRGTEGASREGSCCCESPEDRSGKGKEESTVK